MSEKPTPPGDNECCESGCEPCVWDFYREEMEEWNEEQKKAKATQKTNSEDS